MLVINFHKTFIPERRFLAALLDFFALGKGGTLQEISEQTGIPTGKSTGKVMPTIYYGQGMGLIKESGQKRGGSKKYALTPFGQVVYGEDEFLGEGVTQWLAHLNLCRGDIGAMVWHGVFARGRRVLGSSFTREQLDHWLNSLYPGKGKIGPLINTYREDAALARAGALEEVKRDRLRRGKAPVLEVFGLPYSAYIISLIEDYFPGQGQVTVTDFNQGTLMFEAALWDQGDVEQVLSLVERKGYIAVDRQMRPWILEPRAASRDVWPLIYADLA